MDSLKRGLTAQQCCSSAYSAHQQTLEPAHKMARLTIAMCMLAATCCAAVAAAADPKLMVPDTLVSSKSTKARTSSYYDDTELACMNQMNFKHCRYTGCPGALLDGDSVRTRLVIEVPAVTSTSADSLNHLWQLTALWSLRERPCFTPIAVAFKVSRSCCAHNWRLVRCVRPAVDRTFLSNTGTCTAGDTNFGTCQQCAPDSIYFQ